MPSRLSAPHPPSAEDSASTPDGDAGGAAAAGCGARGEGAAGAAPNGSEPHKGDGDGATAGGGLAVDGLRAGSGGGWGHEGEKGLEGSGEKGGKDAQPRRRPRMCPRTTATARPRAPRGMASGPQAGVAGERFSN